MPKAGIRFGANSHFKKVLADEKGNLSMCKLILRTIIFVELNILYIYIYIYMIPFHFIDKLIFLSRVLCIYMFVKQLQISWLGLVRV